MLISFQHKLAQRFKELSLINPVACLLGIYGSRMLTSANKYVLPLTKTYAKRIKNCLTHKPSIIRQFYPVNPCLLSNDNVLFLQVFKADIQRLTADKIIACCISYLNLKTIFTRSSDHQSSLLKTIRQCLVNKKAHEHFYRLKSLFRHGPQWGKAPITAAREWDLF
ncbi:MAG: hypothetical protein ACM3P1_04570 [Candidatus Saccharibacteria bacterium]